LEAPPLATAGACRRRPAGVAACLAELLRGAGAAGAADEPGRNGAGQYRCVLVREAVWPALGAAAFRDASAEAG